MDQRRTQQACPDCEADGYVLGRRDFLRTAAAATVGGLALGANTAEARPTPQSAAETVVKSLHETLTPKQRDLMCFDWNYVHPERGLLRKHISNNWNITKPYIKGDFYTKDQQALIRQIYEGIFNPDWIERIDQQIMDDSYGKPWGAEQSIAIFGQPGDRDKFMFVMTGRHLTCRADGGSTDRVAFGGPICTRPSWRIRFTRFSMASSNSALSLDQHRRRPLGGAQRRHGRKKPCRRSCPRSNEAGFPSAVCSTVCPRSARFVWTIAARRVAER